ncbi:MAG: T9SS type A sorting domain-containing protein [Bacteroidota bacterium]
MARHSIGRCFLLLWMSLLAALSLDAQSDFAPPGAEWCYQYLTTDHKLEAYIGLRLVKDTFIDPWNVKLMRGQVVEVDSPENLDRYNQDYLYFERNDSIFFIYGKGSPLFYLYDTRYRTADTVLTYLFNSEFLVTRIDSSTFAAEDIHIADMELLLNPSVQLKMYGHLGPSSGFIEGWWTNPLGDNVFELAAYRDDLIGTISLKAESCFSNLEYQEPTRIPRDTCQLSVFPNPVDDPLQLVLDCNNIWERSFQLYIRDTAGRLLVRKDIRLTDRYELPLEDLPSGSYFGVLQNEKEHFDFRFIRAY